MKERRPGVGLARICRLFGVSRQAYYQYTWDIKNRHTEHEIVLKMVREIRMDHPRIGTRKLYHMLQNKLVLHRIKMGRDALFNLLSINQLLVRKRKRRVYTTRSQHWFRKYTNLIKDIDLTAPNQLWVSDITYVEYNKGFLYLSLVTDAFSRKVVGYHIAENLEAVNTLQALRMALKQHNGSMKGLIHHSDRGIQYCCYEYVNLLKDYDIAISMTETGDPRDNPLAERMNGIIKDEYLLNYQIKDINEAKALLSRSIYLYNDQRPHLSINMATPKEIHQTIEC
jgi:transposase InsO family protein